MAALPSPTQVAGTHSAIYEAYYHQVDPNATGMVQAPDAARFLKKSRLSDVVLSKIWDLSDPNGKGYLDKTGFFVALKLVALAQVGKDINMSNIHSEAPPPKVGELPKVLPSHGPARPAAPSPAPSDWSVKPGERDKYNALFDSLQPSNGLIAGNKVKGVLMESKLPLDTLGKIWDLADQDKDGMLDRHEFMVAMHLVYKALEKHAVPTTLPPELRRGAAPPSRPPSRPPSPQPRPPPPRPPPAQSNASLLEGLLDLSSPPSSQPSLIAPLSAPMSAPLAPLGGTTGAGSNWVVSAADKAQYDAMFDVADADRDGLVSGLEIKHTFLESGLPQATLAHIWALCDMEGVGKLNRGQFALAMWLVRRAARGSPPPPALTPEMRPPPHAHAHAHQQLQQPVEPAPTLGPQPTPEMEAIAREVDALARERLALEGEVAARQRELSLNTSEADGLQSELDTLTATLKQLENQKGEAQKRLNDLKSQVEKLRSQVAAQESAAAETEAEVAGRRAAAATLKEREAALQAEVAAGQQQADALTAQLRRSVLLVSQAKIKISHLEEQHRLMEAAVEALSAGGAGAASALTLKPAFDAASLARCVGGGEDEEFPASTEFSGTNGFGSDPFKDGAFPSAPHDPFAPSGPAAPAAPAGHKPEPEGFGRDPFAASGGDPFAGDAFGPTDNKQPADEAWQSDPFAVLHAPTRASPTPSLPPKRHKTPPPRPAPPRPNPPNKTGLDFAEDPFKDYRYEDPFNIEDPFKDATDNKDPFARSSSAVAFQTDDFFSSNMNGSFQKPVEKRSGRVSAPPVAYDPFSSRSEFKPSVSAVPNDNDNWGWKDDWATDDAWSKPATQSKTNDAWANNSKNDWKTDNWANKTDNWATDWSGDQNKNLNETWPSSTLPNKKEKSPKPVKIAKSLVHTIGGIGRTKQKDKKKNKETRSAEVLASEEQQWAWAAAESAKLEAEAEERRRREDAELQLALAISRQEK